MDCLKKRFMSEGVTQREFRDINLEFTTLDLQLELWDIDQLKPLSATVVLY